MQPPSAPTDIPLELPFQAPPKREAVVQERPTLGTLPRTGRNASRWLAPAIDFAAATVALAIAVLAAGASLLPAFPVAPLALVAVSAAIGAYTAERIRAGARMAWPVARLLLAALFVWIASLMTALSEGAQVLLLVGFAALDFGGRALSKPLLHRLQQVERWVLVGDEATAERLRAYAPLRAYASIVHSVSPDEHGANAPDNVAALEIVDRCGADRVVIASRHADDEGLLATVRAFKSLGVPVSLLPRPLDLLEAPAARPNRIGGVPLIEVEALAARDATPYTGPDRRRERRTKVSVIVPAMNEERNVGIVLNDLPDDLHEVILVDGNSQDGTVEAARRAYPGIRVLTQNGRGKGDALRTGFAAVTGNLIVMLDADGSADPAEIPRFVEALESGADFAKGSRFLEGGGSADITRLRSAGNAVLSGTANLLHGTHFTDLCYGYNAFWARCLPFISLDVPGFEVETLINLRMAAAGMRITEVPSYELDRIYGQSNLNTFRDGWRVLKTIVAEARRRRSLRTERPHSPSRARKAATSTVA